MVDVKQVADAADMIVISWHCSRIFIILEWQRDERVARSLM